jgi:hypothetical protein
MTLMTYPISGQNERTENARRVVLRRTDEQVL